MISPARNNSPTNEPHFIRNDYHCDQRLSSVYDQNLTREFRRKMREWRHREGLLYSPVSKSSRYLHFCRSPS